MVRVYSTNEYGVFETSDADIQTYANLYSMCQGDLSSNVKSGIQRVRALNPAFKGLYYYNARTMDVNVHPDQLPLRTNGWLMKDSLGNEIKDDVGYLVDIGIPEAQNWIANYILDKLNYPYNGQYVWDGVALDNSLSCGALWEYFWACPDLSATQYPVNPRPTPHLWTEAEIRNALVDLHNAIKNTIGSKLLMSNGIWDGTRFGNNLAGYSDVLSRSLMDGFYSEGMWLPRNDATMEPFFQDEAQWVNSVEFLIWVQNNFLAGTNRRFVPICELARSGQQPFPNPPAPPEQIATYAFASTLLGIRADTTDQNYFATFMGLNFDQSLHSAYDANIGVPLNSYYATPIVGTANSHIYSRDFTYGRVVVNPSPYLYSVGALTVQPHSATFVVTPTLPFNDNFVDLSKWTQINGSWTAP